MSAKYTNAPTMLQLAANEFVERATRLLSDRSRSFEERENRLSAALNELGRSVMKPLLEAECPDGHEFESEGTRYWPAVRSGQRYLSAFGAVRVERTLYRTKRNGPTVCPLELRAGVVEGLWTPRAARLAALAVSDMTPYRAEAFFKSLGGMQPSRTSLDRLPKALSQRWESNRTTFEQEIREAEVLPVETTTVAVSIDGVMLPMRDCEKQTRKAATRARGRPDKGPAGYREASCGAISFYDNDGVRLHSKRFGRMPEYKMKTLKAILRAEVEHIRRTRPDLTVVAIADGQHGLWEFLDSLQPDHSLVDFYHAAEHLKQAVDLTDGASAVATQRRLHKLRHWLKTERNGARKVIRSLRQKTPKRTAYRACYRRGIGYFKRHERRMRYAELAEQNLPIGSGVVEGTCRWLVSDRMKRTGMRWDHAGGQAILTLRALVHSERFDAAWALLAHTYRGSSAET